MSIANKAIGYLDMNILRADFSILQQTNRGKPMVYLDSSASSQKPQQVIDAVTHFYLNDYANIHRGIYELSERSTKIYEETRDFVQSFIHATHREEIIFVRGATEGINLVASSFGQKFKAGDEIIISEMEHHSNIVPWHLLREQKGIILKIIPVTDLGLLDMDAYQTLFSVRTKLVAVTHASNVLGTINPIKEIAAIAHSHKVPVLVDGAQAFPHMPIDVQALDCDFYTFSAHKAYGPSGVGVLYGKLALLDAMPPYQGGGGMIETVSFSHVAYAKTPHKFEAGTPDMAGVVGMGAALHYLHHIGMQNIFSHEQVLLQYAESELKKIPGLNLIGEAKPKLGVISFVIEGIHPHDLGTVLDDAGIAVRAGHHCAMPLMERFSVPATVRASLGLYNNRTDIDALIKTINLAKRIFA